MLVYQWVSPGQFFRKSSHLGPIFSPQIFSRIASSRRTSGAGDHAGTSPPRAGAGELGGADAETEKSHSFTIFCHGIFGNFCLYFLCVSEIFSFQLQLFWICFGAFFKGNDGSSSLRFPVVVI